MIQTRSVSQHYNGLAKALLTDITISRGYQPKDNKPVFEYFPYKAIWDTGATRTGITLDVVQRLNLSPVGLGRNQTANGIRDCGVYMVNLRLPNGVVFTMLHVIDCILHGFDVVIGMDVISRGDFAVTNSENRTLLSFQIPSIDFIDFTKQMPRPASKPTGPVVGRNEKCPCGSGKKFKHCCGS